MLLHSVDRRVTGRPCVRRDGATLAMAAHLAVIARCTPAYPNRRHNGPSDHPASAARCMPWASRRRSRCEESATGYFGPRSLRGRLGPSTPETRDIPPIAAGEHSRLRFPCAVTRHTGGTRGVDHGPSIGRRCCEGRQRRSRPRVTSRATMSDRPRAWDASGGTHRSIIATRRSPPDLLPGGDRMSGRNVRRARWCDRRPAVCPRGRSGPVEIRGTACAT